MKYCIDVDEPVLEVLEYPPAIEAMDLRDGGDPAKVVFNSERECCDFLIRFNTRLHALSRTRGKGPCMLLRRRDLVLVSLGMKHSTMRHYRKDWECGTAFNLFDQTYYVSAIIQSIERIDEEFFVYHFRLGE